MTIDKAIEVLGDTKLCSPLGQACFVAIQALREKQERAKGCEYCKQIITVMNTRKPPIGIEPHFIWVCRRIHALSAAISRYIQDNRRIPIEWVEEYNKLLKEQEEQK